MPTMTCKVNGLFSIEDDFDDEDLLGTDWTAPSASGPPDSVATAAVSSCALRAPSVTHREPEKKCLRQSAQRSAVPTNGTASDSGAQALSSRQLFPSTSSSSSFSPSSESHSTNVSTVNNTKPNGAAPQSHGSTEVSLKPCAAQDDFDDWDVDLADLDERDSQVAQQIRARSHTPPELTSTPVLRPLNCGRTQAPPHQTTSGASKHNFPPRTLSTAHVGSPVTPPNFPSAPAQCPNVSPGFTVTSPAASPSSGSFVRPQQPQRQWSTPGPSPKPRVGFESFSSPANSSILSPHPLHTPVLTNRLVQLVSASHKLPKKRPPSELQKRRTRRFPGPAGLLPVQPEAQTLDQVVVSVPFTPAHGPVARLPSQVSSSQMDDDDFSGAAWALMKTEMGLDERNPKCFLHSYSVVMVLRKAALKQLVNNKVPNMAVLLKSINYTHTDAKAVFKDPTGEIQGTVHRRLLEDRRDELKAGVVLLLKQVGVFSPSHRNHYLNVTPNNILRIYTPDGVSVSSTQLNPLVLEPVLQSPAPSRSICREPVSRMQLMFDDEDEDGREGERCSEGGRDPHTATAAGATAGRDPEEPDGGAVLQDPGWDADDDLDELLGELPEDTY